MDGAIHKAAGPELKKECKKLNGCETGEAKMTDAYQLSCKKIIHTGNSTHLTTVGPIGEQPKLLESCYWNSLELAREHGLRSIAFPCISTGVYGYPNAPAAQVVIKTLTQWLKEYGECMDSITLCVFLEKDYEIYSSLL